jgi:hypothetical protein
MNSIYILYTRNKQNIKWRILKINQNVIELEGGAKHVEDGNEIMHDP